MKEETDSEIWRKDRHDPRSDQRWKKGLELKGLAVYQGSVITKNVATMNKNRDHEGQPLRGKNEVHFRLNMKWWQDILGECVCVCVYTLNHTKASSVPYNLSVSDILSKLLLQFHTLRCWLYTFLFLLSDQYPGSPNSGYQISLWYTNTIFRDDFNAQSQGKCYSLFILMILTYHSRAYSRHT